MRITFEESTNLEPVTGLFNHATCYKKLQLRVVGQIVLLESLSIRLQAKSQSFLVETKGFSPRVHGCLSMTRCPSILWYIV